jgi:3-oxoacyl-[acyl-carrier protein] reductase
MNLQGKVIFITGAGSGIGRSTCYTCSKYGASIAAIDIAEEEVRETIRHITSSGGKAIGIKADVTKRPEVRRAVEQTVAEYSTIDVLFNNAGSSRFGKLAELDDETFDFIINLNLKGPFICSSEVLKVMIPRKKGRIINNTSYCALRGEVENGPYCAAKAGLSLMTQTLALELGQYNITAIAIAPGNMNTELMQRDFKKRAEMEHIPLEAVYKRCGDKVPIGRVGRPEEIAEVVAFLCDDRSSYINGNNILISGGLVMS